MAGGGGVARCSLKVYVGISRQYVGESLSVADRHKRYGANHASPPPQPKQTHRRTSYHRDHHQLIPLQLTLASAFAEQTNSMDVEHHPAAATTMDLERQNVAHPAAADGEDHSVTSAAPANFDAEAAAPSVTMSTSNRFESDSIRAKFDHSSRKVVIHNVLKFMRSKDVTKLTSSWVNRYNNKSNISNNQIQIVNARKPPKDSWIKVTLADESMVNPFITFINSGGEDGKALVNERGRPLFAKRVDEMVDHDDNDVAHEDEGEGEEGYANTTDGQKRKGTDQANATPVDDESHSNNGSDNNGNNKRFKADTPQKALLSDDEVRNAITPLWRLSYEEQLSSKIREMVNKCANKIVKEIKAKFR